ERSTKRFEQLNFIIDAVLPSIPIAKRGQTRVAYAAVLYACWKQARGIEGEFDASYQQIADASGLDRRSVMRVMKKLQAGKVIKTLRVGYGNRGSKRKFTWKTFGESSDSVSPLSSDSVSPK
ncbi:hypothetical protein N9248_00640, partial [bacterium]|nr:hypothetical protein [bacterium]